MDGWARVSDAEHAAAAQDEGDSDETHDLRDHQQHTPRPDAIETGAEKTSAK